MCKQKQVYQLKYGWFSNYVTPVTNLIKRYRLPWLNYALFIPLPLSFILPVYVKYERSQETFTYIHFHTEQQWESSHAPLSITSSPVYLMTFDKKYWEIKAIPSKYKKKTHKFEKKTF